MNTTKMTDKQTAVEWLQEKLNKILIDNQIQQTEHLFEQAKVMFEEQIIDAHIIGDNTYTVGGAYYDAAEQYFNETYNIKEK